MLRNDSIASSTVAVEPSVWLGKDVDPLRALDALRDALDGVGVRLAETTAEGARLLLVGAQAAPPERAGLEHALRERALRILRDAGVLAQGNPGTDVEGDVRPQV